MISISLDPIPRVLFSDVPFSLPFFPPVKHGHRYSRQQFRNCKNGDRRVPEYIEKILMDEKKARNAAGYYPGTEDAHTNPTRQRGECLRALAGA